MGARIITLLDNYHKPQLIPQLYGGKVITVSEFSEKGLTSLKESEAFFCLSEEEKEELLRDYRQKLSGSTQHKKFN